MAKAQAPPADPFQEHTKGGFEKWLKKEDKSLKPDTIKALTDEGFNSLATFACIQDTDFEILEARKKKKGEYGTGEKLKDGEQVKLEHLAEKSREMKKDRSSKKFKIWLKESKELDEKTKDDMVKKGFDSFETVANMTDKEIEDLKVSEMQQQQLKKLPLKVWTTMEVESKNFKDWLKGEGLKPKTIDALSGQSFQDLKIFACMKDEQFTKLGDDKGQQRLLEDLVLRMRKLKEGADRREKEEREKGSGQKSWKRKTDFPAGGPSKQRKGIKKEPDPAPSTSFAKAEDVDSSSLQPASASYAEPFSANPTPGSSSAMSDCQKAAAEGVGDPHPGYYSMTCSPRGLCIIVNNDKFEKRDQKSTDRPGSDKDAKDLEEVWEQLGFKVIRKDNLTSEQMKNTLELHSKEDHGQYNCFVVCLLSHGEKDHIYGVDWKLVAIQELLAPFKADACKTLAGKPKMFFIQACRGNLRMKGTHVEEDAPSAQRSSQRTPKLIPNEADFLLGYSTVLGYVSNRNPQTGSFYMSHLVDMLEKHGSSEDILSILTKVHEAVGKEDPYILIDDVLEGPFKQSPSTQFTLRKKVQFFPLQSRSALRP